MTQTVFDFLDSLEGTPSVTSLGGEQTIYGSSSELVRDSRVVEVAVALCAEWTDLEDQAAAGALLIDAANTIPVLAVRDLYDVLLAAESALPQIASGLEGAFKARASRHGFERDTALEGWTRLALGHWTKGTLQLRGMLQVGSEAVDATEPLVRALGAACSMWDDAELLDALTALSTHDSLDADAAMELGFQKIATAAASVELEAVRLDLYDAMHWFDTACLEDRRRDATAFRAVVTGVAEQVSGQAIPDERFDVIADAVYEYLDGYRGVEPSWRGARAGTTSAWLDLLTQLRIAETDRWFDTGTTLRALARAFAAEQTMVLVVNPGMAEPAPQVGVRELVWPRIEEIAQGNASVVVHLQRWLKVSGEPTGSATRAAVEGLLGRLEEAPQKKALSGSLRLPDAIRGSFHLTDAAFSELERAAASEPSLVQVFEEIAIQSRSLNLAEDELLSSLLAQCEEHAERGIGAYRTELKVLLADVVRYTSYHLNVSQSPNRLPPWMVLGQPWPEEHELADDLNSKLVMAGRDSAVELPNVAGGRVDIALTFADRCTIYIEVKTVDKDRSDDELVVDFGAQAVQYAVTNIPVAILVVADYVPRKIRRDLTAAFHVVPLRLDSASRQHALVTVRLQANVEPPSATSKKRITRKKRVTPQT
ncbi:hypothetical protein [Frigoribacterium sp. Leaf172]|uniref:hypothetical protein n=1 Tax=Frigoribacterium sp. Leaf172 TaxID=1736285 RepID=UPI000700E9D5|nr:hypothetical protein [Frigoribacterium sp. Leaf172]KQR66499.1 hypothetical protein ASF89_05340 [Frigoribacterium sp. Leaf172]